jgi:DNA-binding winged helix-turn-helix (wHTH) protein/Tol biopolymer transport system component
MDAKQLASGRQLAFGSFRLDLTKRRLWRDGQMVPLTPRVFDTLAALVLRPDQLVEKDELMKLVWPDSFVAEDNLTHNISVLRKALGDLSDPPEFILTISRRGYRFIARVTELPADDGAASVAPNNSDALTFSARPHAVVEEGSVLVAKSLLGSWIGIAALASLLAGLVIFARVVFLAHAVPPAVGFIRFVVNAPEGTTIVTGAVLSPDARHFAFVAADHSGKTRLWVRSLDSAESRVVPQTEGASWPFWSPDGQLIGFFADSKLKKVGLGGDPPQTIASVGVTPAGGSWSTSGLILFADRLSALFSVSAEGGMVTPATQLDTSRQESRHRWPQFLPDGQHFLYFVVSANPDRSGVYVGSVGSPERARLLDGLTSAIYAPPGYLVYVRDRALLAQPFDVTRLRFTGGPVPIVGNVSPPQMASGAALSAAAGGLLTFGGNGNAEHLVWFSRSGQRLGTIDTPTVLLNPALSPDQKQLLGQSQEVDRAGIWLVDLERGAATRVAADGSVPLWSPDGARIAFTSGRITGVDDIFVRSAAGHSEDALLLRTVNTKHVHGWSPDGRYIVYVSTNPRQKLDLWLLPTFGDRQPIPFLQTPFDEKQGQVSPDGRWIAYASDESSAWEVYVQSFPVPGGKRTISVGGGTEPQWRRDGRELFYLAPDDTLMAVDVKPGATWQSGRPSALFRTSLPKAASRPRNRYAVTADGQRFVIDSVSDADHQEPMTVLVNWPAALKR